MKKLIFLASAFFALHTTYAAAPVQTLEVSVQGLNCALCGDAMKSTLKQITGARDIEPRLDCGRIYLEVPAEKARQFNEAGLSYSLTANGFNLEGVRPVEQSLAQVRASKDCS